jgi:hypothetical protein
MLRWKSSLKPAASADIASDVLLYVPFTDANASTGADGYVLSSGTHTLTSDVFARAGNAVINTDQTKMNGSATAAYSPAGATSDGWVLDSTISTDLEVGTASPLSIQFWFYCSNAATGAYARLISWGGFAVSGTGFEVESSNTDYDSFIFHEFAGSGYNRRSLGEYQLTANAWNHIYWAFQPSGSSYVGINGTVYTTSGSYISNFAPTVDLHLLKTPSNAANAAKGYVQEFIVKNTVPYTANFTPTTVPLIGGGGPAGDALILNGVTNNATGGVETSMRADASSTVYGGYAIGNMDFRDATKNFSWTDDGLGCLWDQSTDASNWQTLLGSTSGTFYIYEQGTSTLIFSFAWSGEGNWSGTTRRYGTTSLDFTGTVSANATRIDVYHVKD